MINTGMFRFARWVYQAREAAGIFLATMLAATVSAETLDRNKEYGFRIVGVAPPSFELSRIRELRSQHAVVDVLMVMVPDVELCYEDEYILDQIAKKLTGRFDPAEDDDAATNRLYPRLASLLDFTGATINLKTEFDNDPGRAEYLAQNCEAAHEGEDEAALFLRDCGYESTESKTGKVGGKNEECGVATLTRWIKRDDAKHSLLGIADLKITLTPDPVIDHETEDFRANYSLTGSPVFSGSPRAGAPARADPGSPARRSDPGHLPARA